MARALVVTSTSYPMTNDNRVRLIMDLLRAFGYEADYRRSDHVDANVDYDLAVAPVAWNSWTDLHPWVQGTKPYPVLICPQQQPVHSANFPSGAINPYPTAGSKSNNPALLELSDGKMVGCYEWQAVELSTASNATVQGIAKVSDTAEGADEAGVDKWVVWKITGTQGHPVVFCDLQTDTNPVIGLLALFGAANITPPKPFTAYIQEDDIPRTLAVGEGNEQGYIDVLDYLQGKNSLCVVGLDASGGYNETYPEAFAAIAANHPAQKLIIHRHYELGVGEWWWDDTTYPTEDEKIAAFNTEKAALAAAGISADLIQPHYYGFIHLPSNAHGTKGRAAMARLGVRMMRGGLVNVNADKWSFGRVLSCPARAEDGTVYPFRAVWAYSPINNDQTSWQTITGGSLRTYLAGGTGAMNRIREILQYRWLHLYFHGGNLTVGEADDDNTMLKWLTYVFEPMTSLAGAQAVRYATEVDWRRVSMPEIY